VALSCEPLDWAELSAIREEARENKMIADIAFFGFINELERDYSLLRQAELES
jgi:aspartate/tyrosine/aromatic aminotransferase